MGLSDAQMKWLCNHLGHTRQVHLRHYHNLSGFIERSQVARLFLIQDLDLTGKFKGKNLDDVDANGESL